MSPEVQLLAITAASIGFFHTLAGPDHYIPFIAMSKAGGWSQAKTAVVTFLCGVGHVASSVILGFIGIAFGVALSKLELFESVRGDIAAWLLTAFGLTYFVWGLHRAIRGKHHTHYHSHGEDGVHSHEHGHEGGHAHVHRGKRTLTPWVLFAIFVFGPCEPLIPILMYPAVRGSMGDLILITAIFAAATIGTMMLIVMIAARGLALIQPDWIQRYMHPIAGAALSLCGLAILFLGL